MMDDAGTSWILFSSKQCRPQLVFLQRNGDSRIVIVQYEVRKKISTLSDFQLALFSLHPTDFFKKSKDEQNEGDDKSLG